MKFADKVKEAKFEAERFLKRVAEWEAVQGKFYTVNYHNATDKFPIHTPKENGAVKRSSMDLTRSLANLRKSI